MSFYLDHFLPTYDKKTKFVLLQLHSSQKTVVLQPNVEVWSIGDQLTLSLRNNTRPVPPSLGEIGTYDDYYTSKTNTTQLFVNLGKLQKQKWYCFVINAKWSHTPNEGHTKIWMNGVMVHEQFNNPNAYENLDPTLGIYPKIGIYAPAGFSTDVWGNSDPWVKSYVDFVTLADPRGMSAREMYSRTPCGEIKVFPAYPKTG